MDNIVYRQGANSMPIVGRLSTLQCPLSEVPLLLVPPRYPFCSAHRERDGFASDDSGLPPNQQRNARMDRTGSKDCVIS